MGLKSLFRITAALMLLISVFAATTQANADDPVPAEIVYRTTTYWNAIFVGNVDGARFERWSLPFDQEYNFLVTVTGTSGDLVPAVLLLDATGTEIMRGTGTLTSIQPAGTYFVQVQPETGTGSYNMTIEQVDDGEPTPPPPPSDDPTVTTVVEPTSLAVGGSATATVSLANLPEGGYASTEFTCTYDPAILEVGNIVEGGLFGTDAAVAVNGPTSGSFILAVAGSNGQKAGADGAALTFNVTALQIGSSDIACAAKVSTGDGTLTSIASTGATLPVVATQGTLAGQVNAVKPVTVTLFNADNSEAGTVIANADGTFSLAAAAGTYTVTAKAEGFLGAQGSAVIISGETLTKPTISLLAGDVDGNGVIDAFDAMTIGLNYNLAAPAAADLNNDGVINVLDLERLAANYHQSGALAWE